MAIQIVNTYTAEAHKERQAGSRSDNEQVLDVLKTLEIGGAFDFKPEGDVEAARKYLHTLRAYLNKKAGVKARCRYDSKTNLLTVTREALA